eukprot:XP_002532142.2 uncharacterized protein LOC8271812 [Ricinus communis]
MLNNLMSQQLPIQSIQMGQVEPISNKLDSSIQMGIVGPENSGRLQQIPMANMQMGMMGPVSSDALSQQISALHNKAQPLEPMPNNNVLQKLSVTNMQIGNIDPRASSLTPEQFLLHSNVGSLQSTMLKRKAPMESTSNSPGLQKLSMPNKRVVQMEHRPWMQHLSAPNKLPVQSQSISSPSGLQRSQAPSKKSTSSKAGLQQLSAQKNQSGQPSPRFQSESSESVRSKLRESLAAALALVSMQQDTSGKSSENEDASIAGSTQENSKSSVHDLGTTDAGNHMSEGAKRSLSVKEDPLDQKRNDDHSTAQGFSSSNAGDCLQPSKTDGQSTISMRDEETSFSDCFFVKDELLQGNGLSWVLEPVMGVAENKDIETTKRPLDLEDSSHVSGGQAVPSPQTVASTIEAELYNLFGGVNKKYKEKGRSLLFNLKDRNNPELRARVMSGEIPPEKLCSMTAEELASKELSEWRMAKAEELAQMVVLPDSDVDMRRLVKKTHKGEFQVEVEPVDIVSAEVAIGASSVTRMRPKPKEKRASSPSKRDQMKDKGYASNEKSSSEVEDVLMIPSSEGTDLMQGLMVDDELKDAEFLPPIVSLDEFMESLNSEPPFENLPVDSGKTAPVSDKDDSQVGSESKSPDATIRDPDDRTSSSRDIVDVKHIKPDTDGKSTDNHGKSETAPTFHVPKGECVWEGLLQLNVSVLASVIGIFKSGEKTSSKGWPGLIEIKGRVRLEPFEKFLQELPMSRSRAVMAVHFVGKEGSSESESAGVSEVADSYVMDSRVGFGEPAPGVELYLCPPHSKTREMLGKVLPKDQVDALNAIDNGLIGVIVWRKPQITSTISPNSASHHKHNSKKEHFTSRRHQEKDANLNVNVTAKQQPLPLAGPSAFTKPQPDDNEDDDDDDLPPGFGPPATRDGDDLPEFNFSSGSVTPRSQTSTTQSVIQGQGMSHFHQHSQAHSRPVDQMRELVHRYGQPKTSTSSGNWQDKRGFGVVVQPWDDDDDDMPEWRPEDNKQVPHPRPHTHSQPVHMHGIQQPILRANMIQETPHQQMAQQPMSLQPMLRPNMVQETPQQMAQPAMPLHSQMNGIHGHQNTAPSWQQQGPWMVQQNSAPLWQQQGPWMVPNPGSHGLPVYQPNSVQFYGAPGPEAGQQGMAWRRDAPASRGF